MGLAIDFIIGTLRFIGIMFISLMFVIGLVTVIDNVSDSYDNNPPTTIYSHCMADCDKLNKEYLHTRYMGSPDEECYCIDNNESVRIW